MNSCSVFRHSRQSVVSFTVPSVRDEGGGEEESAGRKAV